jgi:6-phosphofructokinase 2
VIEIAQHTRENMIATDQSTGLQYRFGMPGPVIRETEWKELLQKIEEIPQLDYLVASGSVPEGVPADILARIAAIARKKNARCIIDSSGEPLLHALREGIYLVKPNLSELSALAGKEELSNGMVETEARDLIAKHACEAVVVSLGPSGAWLVTKNISRQVTPPIVKVRSTVGAGDSMVAGIVHGLANAKELHDAVRYGVACGTAATMNLGTQLCNPKDVDNMYQAILKRENQ